MSPEEREQLMLGMAPAHAAALTAYGEARNQPVMGIVAVLNVLSNRRLAKGWSIPKIALMPRIFSCWNDDDPNQPTLVRLAHLLGSGMPPPYNPPLEVCVMLADRLTRNALVDNTHGSTHYANVAVAGTPYWAKAPAEQTVVIGDHTFWKKVKF